MKEEQKQIYYINKKLSSSNNFNEILEGLSEAEEFIKRVQYLSPLNSIVITLLELFHTAKFSYIRIQSSNILKKCNNFVKELTSKAQIVSVLSRCLKFNDCFVRILAMEIVEALYILFEKDNSVYHLLLTKIKWRNQISLKEQVATIKCLKCLLSKSDYLSGIFKNNLTELEELGGIEAKVIVYLCCFAKFEGSEYPRVLLEIWQACENKIIEEQRKYSAKGLQNRMGCIEFYFSKLVEKSCYLNYLCINIYNTKIASKIPSLTSKITKISQTHFSFLSNFSSQAHINFNLMDNEDFLDVCFESLNLQGTINEELEECVKSRILNCMQMANGKCDKNILFLSFFLRFEVREELGLKEFFEAFDINECFADLNLRLKFLKIALTTANFKFAEKINETLFNTNLWKKMSAFILFQSYCELHLNPLPENLTQFLVVCSNLSLAENHTKLFELCKKWKKIHENVDMDSTNCDFSKLEGYYLPEPSLKVEQGNEKEMSFEEKKYELPSNLKINCVEELKSLEENSFLFKPVCLFGRKYGDIYFTKQTIIDILKFI